MAQKVSIALDAMGGDAAPEMVLAGADIARVRFPDVEFLFFGREGEIRPLLEKRPKLQAVSQIFHCDDAVRGDEKPSIALRSGRASSMRLAINAVKDGAAQGIVSAGNTGALMAMAKFVLKTLPGVDRPAIASFFPSLRSETLMLDLGANISCDARNLFQFAIMGAAFSRTLSGLDRPKVGLLNVGSEDTKGHEELQEAAHLLRESAFAAEFIGFIEGDDITNGKADVVITDGFTGNVALKTAEGTARLVSHYIKQTFRSSWMASLGYILAQSALKKMRHRIDPRRYNGAIFLGLNGICVKSHGGTDSLGFANAIGVAVDMAKGDVLDRLKYDFLALKDHEGSAEAAVPAV